MCRGVKDDLCLCVCVYYYVTADENVYFLHVCESKISENQEFQ